MKKAEMEVVRFTESDVIVASGDVLLQSITLNRFGDGQNNNASITIGDITYGGQQSGHPYSEAFSIYSNFDNNTQFKHTGGQSVFSSIYNLDTDGSTNPSVDGSYVWNAEGRYFDHQ